MRYCFRHPDGFIIEGEYEIREYDDIKDGITLEDGTFCPRDLEYEWDHQRTQCPSTYPMISRALAVHPSQRKEYTEFARKNGVPTYFDKMGHPVFESRKHRKDYANLVGAKDFDGGFSDPT